jgi:hypothetical protein
MASAAGVNANAPATSGAHRDHRPPASARRCPVQVYGGNDPAATTPAPAVTRGGGRVDVGQQAPLGQGPPLTSQLPVQGAAPQAKPGARPDSCAGRGATASCASLPPPDQCRAVHKPDEVLCHRRGPFRWCQPAAYCGIRGAL